MPTSDLSLPQEPNSIVLPNSSGTKTNQGATKKPGVKLYIYAVAGAALLCAVGLLWDIAWHTSIGRDRFFTPPHIVIYLGAILGGVFWGYRC